MPPPHLRYRPNSPWFDKWNRTTFYDLVEQAFHEAYQNYRQSRWVESFAKFMETVVPYDLRPLSDAALKAIDEPEPAPLDAELLFLLIQFLAPHTRNFYAMDHLRSLAYRCFVIVQDRGMPEGSDVNIPITQDVVRKVRVEHLEVLNLLLAQLSEEWNTIHKTNHNPKTFSGYILGGNAFSYYHRAKLAAANLSYVAIHSHDSYQNFVYALRQHDIKFSDYAEATPLPRMRKTLLYLDSYKSRLREIVWHQLEPCERAWRNMSLTQIATDYSDAIEP